MKIKTYFLFLPALFIILMSCDDDLNTVGTNIRPGEDVDVHSDTLHASAKTVPLGAVFAWTTNALLGEYKDQMFGSVKADYLCEYRPAAEPFKDDVVSIDSVRLVISFTEFSGDTLAPMGVSIYQLNKKLDNNFYTDIDPEKYYSKSDLLGQATYTIAGARENALRDELGLISGRDIIVNLNKEIGDRFYQEYLKDNGILEDEEKFSELFRGTYITNTFGSDNLIVVSETSLDIYYSYKQYNDSTQQDDILPWIFSLAVTPEVVQLNHVENKDIPSDLFEENTGAVYLRSPAALGVEVTFPIMELKSKLGDASHDVLNLGKFSFSGFSQKEETEIKDGSARPKALLLIDKDSVDVFFRNRQLIDGKTRLLFQRDEDTNIYNLYTGGSTISNNIAPLLTEYVRRDIQTDPVFMLIPVELEYRSSGSSEIKGIYNNMRPSSAILRSGRENMKLPLIISRYK